MKEEFFAAIAATLQQLDVPAERIQRASGVAQPINDRISAACLQRLTLDDHPADFVALLRRSASQS